MKAVVVALDEGEFASVDELLKKAGMTLVSTVGGASGPLYGTFFLRFGTALTGEITPASVGEALHAGVGGILARGKAELGDKTMYDAWAPALEAYDAAVAGGAGLAEALRAAADAAAKGRDATDPAGRAEGPRQLPRRAERGPPGPRRHQHDPACWSRLPARSA